MIRATIVRPAGSWNGAAADTVVLEFDDRHRRRTVMTGVRGLAFLLDLPDALMLRGGDALVLEDDRLVEVVSAPEPLIEIRARQPGDLVRFAWHIGNRHLPAQILPNAIRIRQDPVIAEMLQKLGAKLAAIEAPFDPEGGAYAVGGQGHAAGDHEGHGGHGHHDHSAHDHDHHDHEKSHEHGTHDHDHHHGNHKHEH